MNGVVSECCGLFFFFLMMSGKMKKLNFENVVFLI